MELDTFLSHAYSVKDAHHKILLLREFFEYNFFKSHFESPRTELLASFLKERGEEQDTIDAMVGLGPLFYDQVTRDTVYDFLEALTQKIKSCRSVVLYVPILFDTKEIKKMSEWIRNELGKDTLVDLKIDETTVGGCKIMWNGVLHDFSINYFMRKEHRLITENIKKHVRA